MESNNLELQQHSIKTYLFVLHQENICSIISVMAINLYEAETKAKLKYRDNFTKFVEISEDFQKIYEIKECNLNNIKVE